MKTHTRQQGPPRAAATWATAVYWALVGALVGFGVAAMLTIGIFLLAAAVVLVLIALALKFDARTLPAMVLGAAALPFYLAASNWQGPGTVCSRTPTSVSCGELLNPWPFLVAGVVLVLVGAALLVVFGRRR